MSKTACGPIEGQTSQLISFSLHQIYSGDGLAVTSIKVKLHHRVKVMTVVTLTTAFFYPCGCVTPLPCKGNGVRLCFSPDWEPNRWGGDTSLIHLYQRRKAELPGIRRWLPHCQSALALFPGQTMMERCHRSGVLLLQQCPPLVNRLINILIMTRWHCAMKSNMCPLLHGPKPVLFSLYPY